MILPQALRYFFGCWFEHTGRWGDPVDETWHKSSSVTGEPIKGSEYVRTVQRRRCTACGACEERYIS